MHQRLDVSELEPCQPLEQTMAASLALKKGDYLEMWHRRRPNLLFPMLQEAGFEWRCCKGEQRPVALFIWRRDDAEARKQALADSEHLLELD